MTNNMKRTLERLFNAEGNADFAPMSTAWALRRRGLISIPAPGGPGVRQRTAGGQFPEYWVSLTAVGREWCLAQYSKIDTQSFS